MADQDPPVGPLRRLDPAQPDEILDLGRLERLEPEAEEAAPATAPAQQSTGPERGTRPRNGLALAIAIAVLLSLSSIAAIGGLVAISVQGLDPAPAPVISAPIDAAASGPTIRVIDSAAGPESPEGSSPAGSADEEAPEEAVAPPAPAPASAPLPPPSTEREKKDGKADGKKARRPYRGSDGAWCDASAGTTCDVVVGGPAPRSSTDGSDGQATVDGTGFLRTDEEGEVLDDDLDDDMDDGSHGSSSHGSSSHPGKSWKH